MHNLSRKISFWYEKKISGGGKVEVLDELNESRKRMQENTRTLKRAQRRIKKQSCATV